MLYTTEQETAEKLFSEFAQRKQSPTLVVPICGLGQSEERAAKRCLQKGMEEVCCYHGFVIFDHSFMFLIVD